MSQKINSRGFTLLEILLVVGIIAILAGIVIVAINPARQLASARNTERRSDLKQIYSAIQQYYIENGTYPSDIPTGSPEEICDTGTATSSHPSIDCGTLIDLSVLVPTYITAIPADPQGPLSFLNQLLPTAYAVAGTGNGYEVGIDSTGKTILTAPNAELGVVIALGTTTVATGTTPGLPVALVPVMTNYNSPAPYIITTSANYGTDYGWHLFATDTWGTPYYVWSLYSQNPDNEGWL